MSGIDRSPPFVPIAQPADEQVASSLLMMESPRRRHRTMTAQPKEKLTDMRRREESAKQAALSKRLVEDLKDERRAAPDKKWAARS